MDDSTEELEGTAGEVATPSAYPAGDEAQNGVNLPLLGVLVVILGLVIVSNIWLRRRADRENAERGDDA